ncbi:hypothetical protein [Campylobacter vicugnae]|uniref:hypothetical protein n=1 Tax=Campylobacter vicugnae TaxID=1660076 RepID=UPI000A34C6E8|nr:MULTISPECIES: hypothetical protein [Campylobacter]MDL0095119.1 hypothetical protein [Campylobacter ovis]
MKVADAYSMICMVFASNFANAITDESIKKLKPNWMIKTDNPENAKGNELLSKALSHCTASDLAADLEGFKGACSLKFFKQISDEDMEHFYKQINFNKPFANLRATHISNMFALLSIIFKNDTNDKTHALLGLYLVDFFLPSLILFAKFLRYNAKTPYYQAMGELIMDFIKTIKANLGLKIDIK